EQAQLVSESLRGVAGVIEAYPLVTAEALATGPSTQATLGMVRAMTPEDLQATEFIASSLAFGGDPEFGADEYGGDLIYVGRGLAQIMGAGIGDPIELMIPGGAQTAFGTSPRRKAYTVADFIDTGLEDYNRVIVYMPLEQAQIFFNKR